MRAVVKMVTSLSAVLSLAVGAALAIAYWPSPLPHAPGLSMGQEFQELARAGLSPLKILQMTTRDPARFLGRTETMGSVTVGKDADLVLLSANPLSEASNLTRISGVIRSGHYHSRDELALLRRRIASGGGRLE